jgi:hypothetical protein
MKASRNHGSRSCANWIRWLARKFGWIVWEGSSSPWCWIFTAQGMAASTITCVLVKSQKPVAKKKSTARRKWRGRLMARSESTGRPIEARDAFIAATAEVHGLTLVTRNTSDFEPTRKSDYQPLDLTAD